MKKFVIAAFLACLASPAFAQQMSPTPPPKNDKIAPSDVFVADALKNSPRHGEFVDIKMPSGPSVKSWVVYPERPDKAGVVIVIHEIFGLSDWVRAVADQLAKDGFIAIAPDLLSGFGPNGGGTAEAPDQATTIIRQVTTPIANERLNAVMAYGKSLPASNGKTASVGFCWGGTTSFAYAVAQPGLAGAVAFYGTAPAKMVDGKSVVDADALAKVKAPVLGLYGGNDARVTATVEDTTTQMKTLGKSYDPHIFAGAGHGFMRQQGGGDGSNYKAASEAWPLVIAFLTKNLK